MKEGDFWEWAGGIDVFSFCEPHKGSAMVRGCAHCWSARRDAPGIYVFRIPDRGVLRLCRSSPTERSRGQHRHLQPRVPGARAGVAIAPTVSASPHQRHIRTQRTRKRSTGRLSPPTHRQSTLNRCDSCSARKQNPSYVARLWTGPPPVSGV